MVGERERERERWCHHKFQMRKLCYPLDFAYCARNRKENEAEKKMGKWEIMRGKKEGN